VHERHQKHCEAEIKLPYSTPPMRWALLRGGDVCCGYVVRNRKTMNVVYGFGSAGVRSRPVEGFLLALHKLILWITCVCRFITMKLAVACFFAAVACVQAEDCVQGTFKATLLPVSCLDCPAGKYGLVLGGCAKCTAGTFTGMYPFPRNTIPFCLYCDLQICTLRQVARRARRDTAVPLVPPGAS
jgi:hypothetical protein